MLLLTSSSTNALIISLNQHASYLNSHERWGNQGVICCYARFYPTFNHQKICSSSLRMCREIETLTRASSWWSLSSTLDPEGCSNDTIWKEEDWSIKVMWPLRNKTKAVILLSTKVGTSVYMPVLHLIWHKTSNQLSIP